MGAFGGCMRVGGGGWVGGGQMVESTAPSLSALATMIWTFVLTNFIKGFWAGGFRTKLPVLRAVGWRYIAGIGYIQDN